MPHPDRILIAMLAEICAEAGIRLTPLSDDWTLRLEKAGRVGHVYGYNFELNSAAAQLIASDKYATFCLLRHCGVPAIPHRMFLHPALAADYLPDTGNWAAILAFFAEHAQDVVCKLNTGSGGYHVTRARSVPELEACVYRLFRDARAICLAPFVQILNEYRIFIHHHQAPLIYRKERPFVTGDGQRRLFELVYDKYARLPAESADVIPLAGATIELNWKHNLAQGAKARIVQDLELAAFLQDLALQAARALGIRLAAVDIVETPDGPAVLEVNSGIMMESFARQGEREYALARDFYRQVVLEMIEESLGTAGTPSV
ncbi:MAG TPA: hypothetical protein V6D23_08790 [Candidatus Obscuribacterales bacterium]